MHCQRFAGNLTSMHTPDTQKQYFIRGVYPSKLWSAEEARVEPLEVS